MVLSVMFLVKRGKNMRLIPYASVIRSIMYVMLCTRLDVAYSVKPIGWDVTNILKYLRRTKDFSLVYRGSVDEINVFQTDRDGFKSQGYVFTLNGGAISLKSSKEDMIAYSIIETEYIAPSDATYCVLQFFIWVLLMEVPYVLDL
ncbi:hypothetical protein OSB04_012090 [Centaurea solstitialis]|uniref:Uncharacterized protein n=1 Tax=Centaurea solstitialis TaxID=347529 RepID=A0AA38TNT5_9ASTR|nr:hypothetical protein OSB04_012090 [Centaurea solstitialis]